MGETGRKAKVPRRHCGWRFTATVRRRGGSRSPSRRRFFRSVCLLRFAALIRCYNALSVRKGGLPLMFQPDLLKGRSIFLTGGGTGLGRSMALHFAKLGARLFHQLVALPIAYFEARRVGDGPAVGLRGALAGELLRRLRVPAHTRSRRRQGHRAQGRAAHQWPRWLRTLGSLARCRADWTRLCARRHSAPHTDRKPRA